MMGRGMRLWGAVCAAALIWAQAGAAQAPEAGYVPQANYCSSGGGNGGGSPLCAAIPGNIGPDPALDQRIAYNGIVGAQPSSAQTDPQTPFDNLSWQSFVALNWTAGKEGQPAAEGLQSEGNRVWQGWQRVSEVFGDGPVQAKCGNPENLPVYSIASNGHGEAVEQNEEYVQAATGRPVIDVGGNWTLFERRVNGVETAYLRAPDGHRDWTLVTQAGQKVFAGNGQQVYFPPQATASDTGAIELKIAWRILDPKDHEANRRRFFLTRALLAVAPDLVENGKAGPVCDTVDLGMVGMHIMQKNPKTTNSLKNEWFWSTFEHVDNAPLAAQPCDPASPGSCAAIGQLDCAAAPPAQAYSYFNPDCPDCATNQPPPKKRGQRAFVWNKTMPYAKGYLQTVTSGGKSLSVGTQVSRCWSIYSLTDQLNAQWRDQLARVDSVFRNYMLVGTQWGGNMTPTPNPKIPPGTVPAFLSNSVIETYLQMMVDPHNAFATGSCITCHREARLPLKTSTRIPSDFSFLPELAQPGLVRRGGGEAIR